MSKTRVTVTLTNEEARAVYDEMEGVPFGEKVRAKITERELQPWKLDLEPGRSWVGPHPDGKFVWRNRAEAALAKRDGRIAELEAEVEQFMQVERERSRLIEGGQGDHYLPREYDGTVSTVNMEFDENGSMRVCPDKDLEK